MTTPTKSSATTLAIDGGKSLLRVAIDDGQSIAYGEAVGTFYGAAPDNISPIVDTIGRAVTASGHNGSIDRICAGLTGMPADPCDVSMLASRLTSQFGTRELLLFEDSVIAHYGALAAPGTVVSAGTGVVVFAIGADGATARRDGWGPVFGDRGSGFDIGQAGLRAAWAAIDGVAVDGRTVLVDAVADYLGGATMARIQEFFRQDQLFARVSEFAPAVFAAARSGDRVSIDIVDGAAGALAATAASAASAVGERAVSYGGRLFDAGPALLRPFTAELERRDLTVVAPLDNALAGALGLAEATFGPDKNTGAYQGVIAAALAGVSA